MPTLKFKRFAKPHILKRIQRNLLDQFFARFEEDFHERNLALPPLSLPDNEYLAVVVRLLLSPEGLPDRLNEALFAIDEMSSPRGHELLTVACRSAGLLSHFGGDCSREEMALQIWLAAPELLARTHNAQRLRRLTAFEYAGSKLPAAQRLPCPPPAEASLDALRSSLDAWFDGNERGEKTTKIEIYPLDDEFWFLVRHGDTFIRTPKVEKQRTEIIHYRPERDDVIVYSPEHDELRINARTKGERDLYVEQFGLHLRGRANYFSERETYTLEPLRTEGLDSLDTRDVEGIVKIVLREVEVDLGDTHHQVITRAAIDVFRSSPVFPALPEAIPDHGVLARAVFELQFIGSGKPRPVEVRPPNILRFGRRCDAPLIHRWLSKRGFRRRSKQ